MELKDTISIIKINVDKNQALVVKYQVQGVPTFIVNGKMFWGQDRLDFVLNEAKKILVDFQKKYFDKSDYGTQIIQHLGPALDIIPTLETTFDLVFMDADKPNYIKYFHQIIDKLNPGGVILSDNVLWSGKILEENPKKDDIDTIGLKRFNKMVQDDPRVQNILLPIRDGLMVCRKL